MNDRCSICGTPYEGPVQKWNGGNPIEVMLPACDCEADALADAFLDRLAKRKETTT
jgi:NADH:ubiquinone oxidoreductase subunit B-like Fe-S oxidoreductase